MIGYFPRDPMGRPPVLWLGPVGLRFGRNRSPLFSERYQGTRGIPRRWLYLFGGRLTIIRRRRIPHSHDTTNEGETK